MFLNEDEKRELIERASMPREMQQELPQQPAAKPMTCRVSYDNDGESTVVKVANVLAVCNILMGVFAIVGGGLAASDSYGNDKTMLLILGFGGALLWFTLAIVAIACGRYIDKH